MSDGPLTVTKVLVHFADSKLSPGRPTLHREKMLDWTSPPDQMAERQGLASIYSVYNKPAVPSDLFIRLTESMISAGEQLA